MRADSDGRRGAAPSTRPEDRATAGPSIPSATGGAWRAADAHAYEQDPVGFLTRAGQRCGDIFRFHRRSVFLNHPDTVHAVLAATGREIHAGRDLLNGFRRTPDEITDLWLRGRRAGRSGLTASAASAGAVRMRERLRAGLAAHADVPTDVPAVAPGLCSGPTLAYCLTEVPPALPALVGETAERLNVVLDSSVPWPAWVPGSAAHRARAAVRSLAALLTETVEGRLRDRARHHPTDPEPDLLDTLLAGADSPQDARAALQMILSATHVIPGAALTWLIAELAGREDVVAAIRAEVATLGWSGDLPYTTAVVRETLRLHPPVWLMTRDVATPTEVGGYRVVPGDQLVFSPYLLHRDPRWWEAPTEFRPERWLGTSLSGTTHRAHLPFGGGIRICAGYRLGLLHLTLAAALLSTGYDLETVGETDLTPTFQSVLVPTRLHAVWWPRAG